MRKKIGIVFLSAVVWGLWSCSDKQTDDIGSKPDGFADGAIVFNVKTVGSDTRATRAEETPKDEDFDTEFDVGNEYKITSDEGANVAFFFDATGAYLDRVNLEIISEQDVTHDGHGAFGEGDNYKERLLKTSGIKIDELEAGIASCVLILNADPNELDKLGEITHLDDFKDQTQELVSGAEGNTLGQYKARDGKIYLTMSNTVYLKDSKVQGPIKIAGKIYPTKEEAEADPVQVHVERVTAKFMVVFNEESLPNSANGKYIITAGKDEKELLLPVASSNEEQEPTKTKWGVLVNNWDVNGTETATYWIKNLQDGKTEYGKWSADYKDNTQGWNDAARLRSYWAVDPHYNLEDADKYPQQYRKADGVSYGATDGANFPLRDDLALHYIPYSKIGKKFASSGTETSSDYYAYAPENTFEYNWFSSNPGAPDYDYHGDDYKRTSTHVLIAAQLLIDDEIENHSSIADKYCYNDIYWKAENGQAPAALIKTMVSAVLATGSFTLYKEDGTEFDTQTEAADYFELKKPANIKGGDGRVMLSLKEGAGSLYVKSEGEDEGEANGTTEVTDETLKETIQAVGTAKHFSEGKMYYYIPIKHMAARSSNGDYNVGAYGVVRNHWYKVEIASISNPGIPVDQPDQPIIPTDEPDISFEIVVIPWREIQQDIEF
ncbi:MAG: Mfa1 fimbrilin C-terminal domain-containing protein [Prevotella sp.]|nr:Mfa1 fimbrilin C-terminal domain-containing protein [Prevotella sp.]